MVRLAEGSPWLYEILEDTLRLLEQTYRAVEDQRDPDIAHRIDALAHQLLQLPPPDDFPETVKPSLHRHASEILHALVALACDLQHEHGETDQHVPRRPERN